MPFKSEAQRRKFYAMANRGEISDATVKKWEAHTKDQDLPERADKQEKKAALRRLLKIAAATVCNRPESRKMALLPLLRKAAGLNQKGSSFGAGS
jgi:hypothetical protein